MQADRNFWQDYVSIVRARDFCDILTSIGNGFGKPQICVNKQHKSHVNKRQFSSKKGFVAHCSSWACPGNNTKTR